MKNTFRQLIYLTLILASLLPLQANACGLCEGRSDHKLHFGASVVGVTLVSYTLSKAGASKSESIFYSILLVGAAGLAKEFLIDDYPEGGDMVANGLGIGAGVILSAVVLEF